MATAAAKAANGISKTAAPLSAAVGLVDLTTYVRDNAPRIVSALSYAATRASELGHWNDMTAYSTLATEIGAQCGLFPAHQPAPGAPITMVAGAAGT